MVEPLATDAGLPEYIVLKSFFVSGHCHGFTIVNTFLMHYPPSTVLFQNGRTSLFGASIPPALIGSVWGVGSGSFMVEPLAIEADVPADLSDIPAQ